MLREMTLLLHPEMHSPSCKRSSTPLYKHVNDGNINVCSMSQLCVICQVFFLIFLKRTMERILLAHQHYAHSIVENCRISMILIEKLHTIEIHTIKIVNCN